MSNVKAKFIICILQCFCTIFWSKGVNMLKFAFWTSHHFHTQNVVSLLYFDIQWCNFTYDAMFSMTSGVPLLTVELKDPRYIVKLEVKMLDITFHLNIMILHKYMLSMTWEWFQLILGSKTQTKENMKSLIFLPPGGGILSHKYSYSFIFWKLLKFQSYLKLIIMHLVVVLVMSDSLFTECICNMLWYLTNSVRPSPLIFSRIM